MTRITPFEHHKNYYQLVGIVIDPTGTFFLSSSDDKLLLGQIDGTTAWENPWMTRGVRLGSPAHSLHNHRLFQVIQGESLSHHVTRFAD